MLVTQSSLMDNGASRRAAVLIWEVILKMYSGILAISSVVNNEHLDARVVNL